MKITIYPESGYLNSDFSVYVDSSDQRKFQIFLDGSALTNLSTGKTQITFKCARAGEHTVEVVETSGQRMLKKFLVYEALKYGDYPIKSVYPLGKRLPVMVHREDGLYFHYLNDTFVHRLETVMADFRLTDHFLFILARGQFTDYGLSFTQRFMIYDLQSSILLLKFEGFYLGLNKVNKVLFFEDNKVKSYSLKRKTFKEILSKVNLVGRWEDYFFVTKDAELIAYETSTNENWNIGKFRLVGRTDNNNFVIVQKEDQYFIYDLQQKKIKTYGSKLKPEIMGDYYAQIHSVNLGWTNYSIQDRLIGNFEEKLTFSYSPKKKLVIIEGKRGYFKVIQAEKFNQLIVLDNNWIKVDKVEPLGEIYYMLCRPEEKIVHCVLYENFSIHLPPGSKNIQMFSNNEKEYLFYDDISKNTITFVIVNIAETGQKIEYENWKFEEYNDARGELILRHCDTAELKRIITTIQFEIVFEGKVYFLSDEYIVTKNQVLQRDDLSAIKRFSGEFIQIIGNIIVTKFEKKLMIMELKKKGRKKRVIPADFTFVKVIPSQDQILLKNNYHYFLIDSIYDGVMKEITSDSERYSGVYVNPKYNHLLFEKNGEVEVFDLDSNSVIKVLPGYFIRFEESGSFVLNQYGSRKYGNRIYSPLTFKDIGEGIGGYTYYSPDGRYTVERYSHEIFDHKLNKYVGEISSKRYGDFLNYVSFEPDGMMMVVSGKFSFSNGTVSIYDKVGSEFKFNEQRKDRTFWANKAVWRAEFSPNGEFIAFYDSIPITTLLELDSKGNVREKTSIHHSSFENFSPNSKMMILGYNRYDAVSMGGQGWIESNELRIYHIDSNKTINQFSEHRSKVIYSAISSDNKKLISRDASGVIIIRKVKEDDTL